MNLDNTTFLGDYDDHFQLRLLDGTLIDLRVNMINEDDIPGAIAHASHQVGITLRKHRLKYKKVDEDYFAFQETPPLNTWFDMTTNTIKIDSLESLYDAIDYVDLMDHRELFELTEITVRQHSYHLTSQNTDEDVWDMYAKLFSFFTTLPSISTLDIDFRVENRLKYTILDAFERNFLTSSTLSTLSTVSTLSTLKAALDDRVVDFICKSSSIKTVHIHALFFREQHLDTKWGDRLAQAGVKELRVRYRNNNWEEVHPRQILRSLALDKWEKWQFHSNGNNVFTGTRFTGNFWGEVIEDVWQI